MLHWTALRVSEGDAVMAKVRPKPLRTVGVISTKTGIWRPHVRYKIKKLVVGVSRLAHTATIFQSTLGLDARFPLYAVASVSDQENCG